MSLEENIREFYSPECMEMILKCGEKLKKDPRLIDADALKEGYEYMGYDATEHPEGSYMEGWCNGFNAAVHHCIHHVIHAPSADVQPERHGFSVIDIKTGDEADPYEIALHEEWAKNLMYCDMEGFAIEEDGSLILVDECGRYEYCPIGRFEVRWS